LTCPTGLHRPAGLRPPPHWYGSSVRIAFGTDERTDLTTFVVEHLTAGGHDIEVVAEGSAWPDAGRAVGGRVAAGDAELGVVCCTTGTGVSIAANKVRGVRAALCADAFTAGGARRWNDANVLALSLRLTTPLLAAEILDAFVSTRFDAAERPLVGRVEPEPDPVPSPGPGPGTGEVQAGSVDAGS
jgi:ribose 5-phosphate isomerase B